MRLSVAEAAHDIYFMNKPEELEFAFPEVLE